MAVPEELTRRTLAKVFAYSVAALVFAAIGVATVNSLVPRVLLILLFPSVLAGDALMTVLYRRRHGRTAD